MVGFVWVWKSNGLCVSHDLWLNSSSFLVWSFKPCIVLSTGLFWSMYISQLCLTVPTLITSDIAIFGAEITYNCEWAAQFPDAFPELHKLQELSSHAVSFWRFSDMNFINETAKKAALVSSNLRLSCSLYVFWKNRKVKGNSAATTTYAHEMGAVEYISIYMQNIWLHC